MRRFRVYDTTNKKYVTDEFSWVVTANGELHELDDGDLIGRPDCIKEDDTGLTDKNGKKIFEGDIVKFNHDFYTCKVVYENGTFGLASNETLEPYSYEDYGMCDNFISLWEIYWNWDNTEQTLSDVEIIGNIHDNPELLEELK